MRTLVIVVSTVKCETEKGGCPFKGGYILSTKPTWQEESYSHQFDSINNSNGGNGG